MTTSIKKWQAEDDARTLATAALIKVTPSRLKSATVAAQKLQKEAQKEAAAMNRVAKKKIMSNKKRKI